MKKVDKGFAISNNGIECEVRGHVQRRALRYVLRYVLRKTGLAMLVASLSSLGAHAAGGSGPGVSAPDGLYGAPSRYCTEFKGGQLRSCQKRNRDCLLLKTQPDGSLYFELHSVQANQHVCGLNGVAKPQGDGYVFSDEDAEGGTWRLSLHDNGRQWAIRQVSAPAGHLSPFCGVHASPDGLRFDKAGKQSAVGRVCFKDE